MYYSRPAVGLQPPSQPISFAGAVFISLFLLIVPAFAFLIVSAPIPDSFRQDKYVATSGHVTNTDITTPAGRSGNGFIPVVWYAYSVNGTAYVGHRIQLETPGYQYLSQAQDYAKKCAEMGAVTVWYDPRNPASSVLITTPMDYQTLIVACSASGTFYLIVVSLLWITRNKTLRRHREAAGGIG